MEGLETSKKNVLTHIQSLIQSRGEGSSERTKLLTLPSNINCVFMGERHNPLEGISDINHCRFSY